MKHRKNGARLLGLLAMAALGVMAFAASAQAVSPAFIVGGIGASNLLAKITAEQEGVGTMLVPGLNFQLSCTKFATDEGLIESNNDGKVVLLYSGCSTLDFTTKAEISCEIVEPIKAEALLLPAELTNGELAVLAEKIKALINMTKVGDLTKPCILPQDNVLTGEACFAIEGNDTATPKVRTDAAVECKERPVLESLSEGAGVKDTLKYGSQASTLDGKAKLSGAGAHSGLAFGVTLELATKLCKNKAESCEAYAVGSAVAASQEQESKFVFPYEGENLEPPCRVSTLASKTTKEGETLIGELTELSFKECGGGVCTVVAQHLPYKVEWKAISEGNGTVVLSSGGSGAPAFTIKCLGVAKCIYGAAEMSFAVTGGTPAKLSNSGVALKREEGSEEACGEKGAIWEGVAAVEGKIAYKITTPSPLFVRA